MSITILHLPLCDYVIADYEIRFNSVDLCQHNFGDWM